MAHKIHATLRPVVEQIEDPMAAVDEAADLLARANLGARPPAKWMNRVRAARTGQTAVSSGAAKSVYEGRRCCYSFLVGYEGRPDLQLPLEIQCPECGARYRIRLQFAHSS